MKKETYSVSEAKARLTEILRKVRGNRRIIITRGGTPVAELVPIQKEPEQLEDYLRRLEEDGMASPARGSLDELKPVASRPGVLKSFLVEREG